MYTIVTDTSSNLDCNLLKAREIRVIPFSYYIDSREQTCLDTVSFDGAAFYNAMRAGMRVTTSQVTPQRYMDCFAPILEAGQDILFVGMSSGISGSFGSAQIAAAQLREQYPGRRLRLIDTLGASLGEGLLALRAADFRDQGMALDEAADILENLRLTMCQVFTVDDLKYLRMTGRLSNFVALVGSALQVKPLLKGNREGKIVCFSKVRGRRRSIHAMAEQYNEFVYAPGEQTVGIAHADCPEDAALLESLLREKKPPRDIMTVCYEPVTGSHVGPGTLALFFQGDISFRRR